MRPRGAPFAAEGREQGVGSAGATVGHGQEVELPVGVSRAEARFDGLSRLDGR
jgi:hypothetical protein